MLPALALMLATAAPPNVAVEPGEPDWELGRQRVVVALTDAGIEPVADGAAGYRNLATVRATCKDDAYAVEVRLLDWSGQAYAVERVTGHGCDDPVHGDEAGAFVAEHIEASCKDRPCTPPPPQIIACSFGFPYRLALRAGVGVLSSYGRDLPTTGAMSLSVAWFFTRHLGLDVDLVGTWVPANDRSGRVGGPLGYGIGRAHLLAGFNRPRVGVHVGVGGGTLVAWAADPDARWGGASNVAATGLVSSVGRVSIRFADRWSMYAGAGVGFGLPVLRLAGGSGRPIADVGRPIIDGTIGLQWWLR